MGLAVNLPGQGRVHAGCISISDAGAAPCPRLRVPPSSFLPTMDGQRYPEGGAPPPGQVMAMQRPRGRVALGQGRADATSDDVAEPEEWVGRWVVDAEGAQGLVIAAAFDRNGWSETLLIVFREGVRGRRAVSWEDARRVLRFLHGARRELVQLTAPPQARSSGSFPGVWRHGDFFDAVTMVVGRELILRRVQAPRGARVSGREALQAAQAYAEMEALEAVARRPGGATILSDPSASSASPRPQLRSRSEVRQPTPGPEDRRRAESARPPPSQRGAPRAVHSSAPSIPETARLQALARSDGGLSVRLVTLIASPRNSSGGYIWGTAWAAQHGSRLLARGSSAAVTYHFSAAALAAAQEALLGLHSFLATRGLVPSRVRVALSIRRARAPRGQSEASTPPSSDEAQASLYASLAGGVGSLMGLNIRFEPHDAPMGCYQGLAEDLNNKYCLTRLPYQ